MVNSITTTTANPYLTQVQSTLSGKSDAADTSTPTQASSGNATAKNLVSSLLSGGSFSPEILSLLQPNASGSFDPINSLLGDGKGDNSGGTISLYSSLFATSSYATIEKASKSTSITPPSETTQSPSQVQDLVDAQSQKSITDNQALVQSIKNAVKSNQTVLPIVA